MSLEQHPAVAQSHVLTSGSPEPLQQGVAKGASEGVSYSPGNGPASARTLRCQRSAVRRMSRIETVASYTEDEVR